MSEAVDEIVRKAQLGFPEVRITGPVSEEDISALESLVSSSLPDEYRHFLHTYGTLGFYGLEVYGLISGNLEGAGPPNAFFMTKDDLQDQSIPLGHVVIHSSGYGPVYILDCSNGNVVGWNYSGLPDETMPRYASFSGFLSEHVDQYLDDYRINSA